MSEITEKIGKRIKKYRMQQGLSQEKLAEKVDCHHTFVGQIERGEKGATIDTLSRFATVLGISLSKLFENIDIEDSKENIPMEAYEFFLSKTPAQQKELFDLVKRIDKYGMNTNNK